PGARLEALAPVCHPGHARIGLPADPGRGNSHANQLRPLSPRARPGPDRADHRGDPPPVQRPTRSRATAARPLLALVILAAQAPSPRTAGSLQTPTHDRAKSIK